MNAMRHEFSEESYFIPVESSPSASIRLHMKRFYKNARGPVVFLLHGAIENGRIFYSQRGRGLAPYLARQGFDVYVGELRGRGQSTPRISRHSRFGQTEAIVEDIPAFMGKIRQLRGKTPGHWVAHSWGGVLMVSSYVRFPKKFGTIASMSFFGTKRTISVRGIRKWLVMDLFWGILGRGIANVWGYFPAVALRMGSDNETNHFHEDIKLWVSPRHPWRDTHDRFDYARAAEKVKLPRTIHFAAVNDPYLGNQKDILDFIRETGVKSVEFRVLSLRNGNLHDYDHISMMSHPDAVRDHFPVMVDWMRSR